MLKYLLTTLVISLLALIGSMHVAHEYYVKGYKAGFDTASEGYRKNISYWVTRPGVKKHGLWRKLASDKGE